MTWTLLPSDTFARAVHAIAPVLACHALVPVWLAVGLFALGRVVDDAPVQR